MPIIIFILGAILFLNPKSIVVAFTYIIGGVFILYGFIKLANYLGNRKKDIINNNELVIAIMIMSCGAFIILFSQVIELTIRLVIGGWILYSGINRIMLSSKMKEIKNAYITSLIIALLMIAMGIYIIFRSNLLFSGVGIFIMFYAVVDIVTYVLFYNSRKKQVIIIK